MNRSIKPLENSIEILTRSAIEFYEGCLLSFAIFGSYARGKATDQSDLDLLIVSEKLPDGRFARVDQWEQIEKVWKKNIHLSPVFFTAEELKLGNPIFFDMTEEEVIILYDKNNTLTNYLKDLKKRLREMGAKRVDKGKSSYWIMGAKSAREVVL